MHHFERKERVGVEKRGGLYHPTSCKNSHSFNYIFKQAMTTTFELVVLEFQKVVLIPRAYCVKPEISRRRYPNHPHLRDDQSLVINGRPLPALCTYLASDGVLEQDEMELVHILDYTSMFLAKHILWVATNVVDRYRLDSPWIRKAPNPGALIFGDDIFVFDGTAGPNAAHTSGAAMET